jgi:hypothetical protein
MKNGKLSKAQIFEFEYAMWLNASLRRVDRTFIEPK